MASKRRKVLIWAAASGVGDVTVQEPTLAPAARPGITHR
jgi:NADPH:quinone reductase-like Zn-dependent oxidoreductase